MAPIWTFTCALLVADWFAVATAAPPLPDGMPTLSRFDFNRMAQRNDSQLFWREDTDRDHEIDPDELEVVGLAADRALYVRDHHFTSRFTRAYRELLELRRQEAVRRELDRGRPTLVQSDLRRIPLQEKRMVRQLLAAAHNIDLLYYRQTGAARYLDRWPQLDPPSRALFRRNSGPWCIAPSQREAPFCNAIPDFPRRRSENYPTDMVQDEALCRRLQDDPNSHLLLAPFTVVRRRGKALTAVPMTRAYAKEAQEIATRLRRAAREVEEVPEDKALREYLVAASDAFVSNDWQRADAAWVAMSTSNSRWYLRVGPDEVYQDVCQRKAAFHLVLARIDTRSIDWKHHLNPLRGEMEQLLAELIGGRYRARPVEFEMPDFIQIVVNAGDSRHALGATIGQSLPNWGTIARQGKARTVVMTNLYTDADSRWVARRQAASLLAPDTLEHFTDSSDPNVLVTILHEASHNLGPHSDFLAHGKSPTEIFGGPLAATLEELKAQVTALWFLQLLQRRGLLAQEQVYQAYTKALMWAFGHLSRGMEQQEGGGASSARPYSQLAAILLGHLRKSGALSWREGRFSLHYPALPSALAQLAQVVGRIKARGAAEDARQLVARYNSTAALRQLHAEEARREMLRHAKASFRYSVSL